MNIIKPILIFSILLIAAIAATSQTIVYELNGFRLAQFRSVTHRMFGKPDMDGASSETVNYEAFLLKDDQSLYMVFQYLKAEPQIIYSIQITGTDERHDPGFRGLKFGQSASEIEKELGKPSKKVSIDEHGTRWEYEKANFSIEISKQNKLSSIRIVDERDKPDFERVPKFRDVITKLQAGTNAELAELLAPDLEVYDAGKVIYFTGLHKDEIKNDSSGVFAAVRRLSKELSNVNPANEGEIVENLRLKQGSDPMPVIKLFKLKGINEIVFRWDGRRWVIWEFGSAKPTNGNDDWMSRYKLGSLKELASGKLQELIKTPNVLMKGPDGKPIANFSYNSYPTKTKVKFTGESRKTSAETLTLLQLWLATIGRSKDEAKLFETEFKFIEDGAVHWLPVQSTLIEHFANEVKKDDDIMIYVAWVGIKYEKEKPVSLTIINEFTTLEPIK
ncbi:MAG: hypothetical protein ACRD6X_17425 [Pyrinomonadaceae bacterium]